MTLTTTRLALIATELEADVGITTTANASEAGYWYRIALALEDAVGASSVANNTIEGYMLRACRALEVASLLPGTGYNATEAGYIARMLASFAVINPGTYNGTSGATLLQAVIDYTGSAAPAGSRFLEDGTPRKLEDGTIRALEA